MILHLYARSRAATTDEAIVEAISHVQGAFSLALMTKDRLIAVRDPHGFRPLALGRLGDAVIVCSETCALDLIGATYVRDVEPGEVVIVSAAGVKSFKPFRAGAVGAVRVRARVLRAPRQLRVRRKRQRGAHEPGPAARAREARGRRRHRARSRLGRLRRDRICRGVGHSDARRADPQPLCRAARSSSRSSRFGISACA